MKPVGQRATALLTVGWFCSWRDLTRDVCATISTPLDCFTGFPSSAEKGRLFSGDGSLHAGAHYRQGKAGRIVSIGNSRVYSASVFHLWFPVKPGTTVLLECREVLEIADEPQSTQALRRKLPLRKMEFGSELVRMDSFGQDKISYQKLRNFFS